MGVTLTVFSDGIGHSPEVCIMMRDAAAGMVNGCGSLSALVHNEMDQLEERFRHLRQSADLQQANSSSQY